MLSRVAVPGRNVELAPLHAVWTAQSCSDCRANSHIVRHQRQSKMQQTSRLCCQSAGSSVGIAQGAGATSTREVTELMEYRRNVGICVINKQGLVFAARRVDDSARSWQMPQGGIDANENPMTAALRELKEETGMQSVVLLGSLDQWLCYDFPTETRCRLQGTWLRYRGQTQKWFLAHFYGEESEIDLTHDGKPEFSEYCWRPLEQLPAEVVAFKREVYHEVATAFTPRIQRWLEEQKQLQDGDPHN